MFGFWIAGFLFTVGLAQEEVEEDGFLSLLFFVLLALFIWPLFLGQLVYCVIESD